MALGSLSVYSSLLLWCTGFVSLQNGVSSEFNSSQPTPLIRTLEIPSSGFSPYGANRFPPGGSNNGGKYRSSFYYPKYKKRTTTATPGSTASPVYVVWSRQGAAGAGAAGGGGVGADAGGYSTSPSGSGGSGSSGASYQNMNDYYHYDLESHQEKYGDKFGDKYNGDKYGDKYGDRYGDKYGDRYGDKYGDKYSAYYNNYPYSAFTQDPYPSETTHIGKHTPKYLRAQDEYDEEEVDEEEEKDDYYDEDNEIEKVEKHTKASKKSNKALSKNRRTGIEHLGGLLSLKGLKLSAIGFFYLFRGIIILLWRFLPWLFLVVVAFLFIPVPIITIPAAAGRSIMNSVNMTEVTGAVTSLAHKVTDSEQCVERISCEIRRRSDDSWIPAAAKLLLFNYGSSLPQTLGRIARSYVQSRPCKFFECNMISKAFE